MQQQDNHEYPFLYQRQTCHQVQPNQATYQKRQKCQDRKSGSAGMPRPISYAVFCLKKKKTECSSPSNNEEHISPPHAPTRTILTLNRRVDVEFSGPET